jgi:hypothetical protein
MRAILRLKTILLATGIGILAGPALAQQSAEPPPATNPPASDAVGPRELQNFSLPGTATKPTEQQPATTEPATSSTKTQTQPAAIAPAPVRRAAPVREAVRRPTPTVSAPAPEAKAAPPTVAPAPALAQPITNQAPQPAPVISAPIPSAATPALAPGPEHGVSILPWLLAALLLAGGVGVFLWRRRPREALAGPQFDLFAAPEPQPAPEPGVRWMPPPSPAPPQPREPVAEPSLAPPARPPSGGIVATRLRPSVEIGVRPLRCLVNDNQVTIEFELELFNAGTAPARAVLAEASLLNASATQDEELAAFFSRPSVSGGSLDAIPPMKRMTMTSQVVAPRSAIQEYELGGHRSFVPVIAFNALYEWSGGKGQTSSAYLVGRETNGDKLGPLRLDSGARDYRGLGARQLPTGVRR